MLVGLMIFTCNIEKLMLIGPVIYNNTIVLYRQWGQAILQQHNLHKFGSTGYIQCWSTSECNVQACMYLLHSLIQYIITIMCSVVRYNNIMPIFLRQIGFCDHVELSVSLSFPSYGIHYYGLWRSHVYRKHISSRIIQHHAWPSVVKSILLFSVLLFVCLWFGLPLQYYNNRKLTWWSQKSCIADVWCTEVTIPTSMYMSQLCQWDYHCVANAKVCIARTMAKYKYM